MNTINKAVENAYKVLDGALLSEDEAVALAEVEGADILDLVSLANKVRVKYAPEILSCSIVNAKSGVCAQNCRFCAQAVNHNTGIETYPLLPKEEILAAAREIYAHGVRTFGIVTSGRGYLKPDEEFARILDMLDALREEMPDLKVCVSLGILSEETAKMLVEHGAWRYNMNLQTNPERYGELITKQHSVEEKISTIKYLQKYGMTICCGGIIGLGESWRDRVKLALAIRELDVDGTPLNVLLPIKGTPLEGMPVMTPADVAKTFAIFRLINPSKMLKFTAGRETVMKDFQGLLTLAGMNAIMTGGYLTTRGRSIEEDKKFIEYLGGFGR
ncbi:MAG: biotin synthase BioB [Victivallaceae bacterium]|nr:biotin synthase BioB [Victivallaceae bacterium]